jgi:hypothetical protein
MEFAAILIVLASAAAVAGLAAAAGYALRRWGRLAWPLPWLALGGAGVGALASLVVIGGLGASLFAGNVAVADVLPYMELIKRREKALYERIETSVIRDRQDGKSDDEIRANAKAIVTSYVADKIAYLPDNLTYALYAATRDMLAHLAAREKFQICADLALGRYKGDIDEHLPPELAERNRENTLRVLNYAPPRPKSETGEELPPERAPHMPAEEFAVLATTAFANASQATGIAPEDVDGLLTGEGEPAKTCKLMKGFFDELLAQPVATAAAALRTLTNGERAVGQY